MPKRTSTAEEFVTLFQKLGPEGTARHLNIGLRSVYGRRRRVEAELGISLKGPEGRTESYNPRTKIDITNGIVLVGGDAHIWTGKRTTGQRAFVGFCKLMKPKAVIINGDVIDAAAISRHPPMQWEDAPDVQDEIAAAQDFLHDVAMAARKATKVWNLGNHDARFETFLATHAPRFKGVKGIHLKDHFPLWEPAWSCEVGGVHGAIVKHRFKGGIHATHTNTLWGGRTIITGHLHSLKVTPFTDYNGTRYGVDSGTLAIPQGPQFSYCEDNPLNWRSGFVVLTWREGVLMMPELVMVHDEEEGVVQFRGELLTV